MFIRSKFRFCAVLFAGSVLAASQVHAGNESRYEAFGLDSGLFEVIAEFTEDAIYWCGAGIFAQSRLSGSATQRVYVWQGPSGSAAKPGQVAVTFGLTPPPSGKVSSLTTDVEIIGNSLSVAQAKQICDVRTASG